MDTESVKFQTKTATQRSALKTSLTSQNHFSRFTSQQSSRKSTLMPSNQEFTQWNFLQARRQSQLNTMFNIRKHKLDEITKANYGIYERINTQSTHYPMKANDHKDQVYKTPHSRFYTIEESRAQNIEHRKVLGPIGNFKALRTPLSETSSIQFKLQENNQKKSVSTAKINTKKLRGLKGQGEHLPAIFQFY